MTDTRSQPRDSWKWIWPDTLMRLLPFWIVALLAAHFLGGFAAIGLIAPPDGWQTAIMLGIVIGLPMTVLAMLWRGQIAPHYQLPSHGDQALQSFFYLAMNAPTEEVFWRGTIQTLAIRGLVAIGCNHTLSTVLGIAAIAVCFGAYHRLGGYPWRFNIAAMLAGALFGVLYVALPGPCIVVPTIVHGMTTAGYLSWGNVALHYRNIRRSNIRSNAAGTLQTTKETPIKSNEIA